MSLPEPSIGELFGRALRGERRALGRLLSIVERGGDPADRVTDLAHRRAGTAHVIGITGAPGAGKSTLTGRLTRLLLDAGARPAVLAIDPSSPLSGGAILGDRIRMEGDVASGWTRDGEGNAARESAFIRSMATRGHSGGLALAVPGAIRLFDATGYDPVIVETVGVGQVEVDIAAAADTTVVVVTPGWGDAVQANKAGLLEVADVFVVNKADRPGADDARRDLELMLDLSHVTGQEERAGHRPSIVMTTAIDGDGTDATWEAIEAHRDHLRASGGIDQRRAARQRLEIADRVERSLRSAIDAALAEADGSATLDAVAARALSPVEAAHRISARLGAWRADDAEPDRPREPR